MNDARALLDALMGKSRNDPSKAKNLKWSDPEVCPYYTCGPFCPHDLFTNTKSDLGPCEREHDAKFKEQFAQEPPRVQERAQLRFLRYIEDMVADVDKRIKRGYDRIQLMSGPIQEDPHTRREREEKLNQITANIQELLNQMEVLGNEGRVDEARALMMLIDGLKAERVELEHKAVEIPAHVQAEQQKHMKVCDICGSFLVAHDAESRITAHVSGKQHLGFQQMRETIKELREKLYGAQSTSDKAESSDKRSPSPSRDRRRDRDSDRAGRSSRSDRDRRRSRSRSRDRRRDRDERDSRRDRDRSRRSRSPRRDRR